MPFSVGPRSCIGANFSLAEQTLILSKLIMKYKFEIPSNINPKNIVEIQRGPIMKPSDELRIIIKKL